MSARRLRLRLQNTGRRLCACAYADVAALWCASLGPAEEARLERRFWQLGGLGAAHRAPPGAVPGPLPAGGVGELPPPPPAMPAKAPSHRGVASAKNQEKTFDFPDVHAYNNNK